MTVAARPLTAADTAALGEFFAACAADPEVARYFHPHPLTAEFAAELCGKLDRINDRYLAVFAGGRVAGYAMLRGWDDGYAVPSFGVCVHPALRDCGLGHSLLALAIREAKRAGAAKMRLTVYKDNARGVHLYTRYGFVFADKDERSLVGTLDLAGAAEEPQRQPDATKLAAWAAMVERRAA
jgi:ribosomal protein S18 acetylase RimI-like enzyme